jgi:pimeloyl-ACP methyl ester carboxylesterase
MPWFEHGTSRIYYEESGSGDPVLLLPGFSDTIAGHLLLRETLRPHYRVIAADLPGSGRSEPQPRQYSASYFDDDARSLIALLQKVAGRPTHLVGFSDGGENALLIAAQAPEVARSVFTWGAAGVVSDPSGQLREAMRNVVDRPIPPMEQYREYLVATYGEANARAMTRSFATALGAIIEAGGDISRSKVAAITCSVLLIAGEHDMFVSKTLLDELAGNIPTAETMVVEGVGHDLHIARPEWFVQTALDWLKGH